MKKIIQFIILMIVALSISSCDYSKIAESGESNEKTNKYEVFEIGGYDNLSGAAHQEEIILDNKEYEKDFVLTSKTVIFNGKNFETEYRNTVKGYLYQNTYDYYENKDDGLLVKFGINIDTGSIDRYSWVNVNYIKEKNDMPQLSRDECFEVAKMYFDKFADSSEYELIEERYQKIPEYQSVYDFTFARVINGLVTSEKAYIGVTIFGDVISHSFVCLGELKNAPILTEKDFQVINNNIDTKIKEIYNNVAEQYQYSYETKEIVLVKLENGKYALEYYIDVKLEPVDSSKVEFVETTKLLIYVE